MCQVYPVWLMNTESTEGSMSSVIGGVNISGTYTAVDQTLWIEFQ